MRRDVFSGLLAGLVGWGIAAAGAAGADVGAAMTAAAQKFADSLSDEQSARLTFEFGAGERLDWHFIPRDRKGVSFREMNAGQRKLADALLRTGLSEVGFEKATNIMRLEAAFHVLEGPDSRWGKDPRRYCITFFGKSSTSGKWAWRVEGHHLSLNFTVKDGKVVSITPAFFGANPANVTEGRMKGLRTLADQQDRAEALLATLDEDQREACITAEKAAREIRDVNKPRPTGGKPTGLAADKMNAAQRQALHGIIDAYLSSFHPELADAARARVKAGGPEHLYFEWRGDVSGRQPHSYRVQGPTFVIEYINKHDPAAHIHSIFRSIKNDFGMLARR
jgi:hypothetical protein